MLLPRRLRVGRRDEQEGASSFPFSDFPFGGPERGGESASFFRVFGPFSGGPKKAGLNRVFTIFWPPPRGGGREQT